MITDPDVLRHFEMTSLIFRMGLKQRAHATALVTRLQGTLMELATIDHAYFYYMGTMGQEFGPPLSIPNTDDFVLTGDWKSYSCIYRASLWYQKTELLRLMNREWKLARPDLSSRGAQAVWASPPRHAATALSEVERLQRLLLWSLALPLLLLWPLYRVRTVTLGPEEGPSWQAALRGGAFSGLFCLAGLLVGDWSIATRSLAYWGVVVRDRSVMAAAPGLPVVMPAVPIAAAAILVLAWAVILTIREHFPPDTHGANDVSLFDFVMICRSSVLFGIWGIALLSFFAACWWALDDHGEPSSFTAWLPAYSQALVLALGVAALLPWWLVRFKDRRRAAGRLRLRLRGMLWGYIALATVLFAGLEGVRLAEHSVMERAIGNLMLN